MAHERLARGEAILGADGERQLVEQALQRARDELEVERNCRQKAEQERDDAIAARQEARSGIYSFEQQSIQFENAQERRFRANADAWKFFQSQPPSHRRVATWRVISAKREETREKRLGRLIEDCENGRRID